MPAKQLSPGETLTGKQLDRIVWEPGDYVCRIQKPITGEQKSFKTKDLPDEQAEYVNIIVWNFIGLSRNATEKFDKLNSIQTAITQETSNGKAVDCVFTKNSPPYYSLAGNNAEKNTLNRIIGGFFSRKLNEEESKRINYLALTDNLIVLQVGQEQGDAGMKNVINGYYRPQSWPKEEVSDYLLPETSDPFDTGALNK